MTSQPPIVMTIAGSDPSGGAGIQADLKTFTALNTYGCAVISGLTVQNTQGVREARGIEPGFVQDQIAAVLDDLPLAATKIGMLADAQTATAVAEVIEARRECFGLIILDPVMVATSGDKLLADEAIEVMRGRLMGLADVITPNLPEAGVLLDTDPATGAEGLVTQTRALIGAGARAALVKGGHLAGEVLTDVYATGGSLEVLTGSKIDTRNTHGTGCTLSSAVAACAARAGDDRVGGVSLGAVRAARDYLFAAIQSGAAWRLSRHPETGHGPVDHLITLGKD